VNGIVNLEDTHEEEAFTNCVVRGLLLEAARTFHEKDIVRFFPVSCKNVPPDELAKHIVSIALEMPNDSDAPVAVHPGLIRVVCLYDQTLFNLAKHGPRRHDPQVIKWLGQKAFRLRRLTLRMSAGLDMGALNVHRDWHQVGKLFLPR
jgi:hypothetical protein